MIITRWRCLLRGYFYRIYIHILGGSAGPGLMVDIGVTFRSLPHKGIEIGSGVYFGRGVIIDVPRSACLQIGDRALITHYTILAASRHIRIGADTQIAEHCSIRDADHGFAKGTPVRCQPLQTSPVRIGADVWIGRGTAVLRGSEIADGCIVGANSVVKAQLASHTVHVGNPLRNLGTRK